MTLSTLYHLLSDAKTGDCLTLTADTAEHIYQGFLMLSENGEVTISGCEITLYEDYVAVSGGTALLPYTSIGQGQIVIQTYGDMTYQVKISIAGSGTLNEFAGELPPFYRNDKRETCLFSQFTIYYPVLLYENKGIEEIPCWKVSGLASCPEADERWEEYREFFTGKVSFTGELKAGFDASVTCNFRFMLQKVMEFPLGSVAADLAMQTVEGDFFMGDMFASKAYLLYDVRLNAGEQVTFWSELFREGNYQSSGAFIDPPLSLANVAVFMQELFWIGENQLLLPENTVLSSFGLLELQMILAKKGDSLLDGLSLERMYSIFSLGTPMDTPIPNLTLEEFQMVWEASWWGEKKPTVTLFAAAKASLVLGSFRLTGEVTGDFPGMDFTGTLKLEQRMTLSDFAGGYGIEIPEEWKGNSKELASLEIGASVRNRFVRIEASVSDVIGFQIGGYAFSLENLSVHTAVAPENRTFGIGGILAFKPEADEPFAFALSAEYADTNWCFRGGIAYGRVKIGTLLLSLLHVTASPSMADIELEELSVSYFMAEKHFTLYASCELKGFSLFGKEIVLGGRISLDQTDRLLASAVLYLDISPFRLLVQANDFCFDEKRSFLFRVEFMERYIQAVYQKVSGEDILTVSLGNMTFGDILLALIHWMNPNAKQTLSKPWNILNEIKLSDFSLVINVTKKSASLLYHVNRNLAGLMEIDDIGLSYSKEDGVRYILTGRLLDRKYTLDDPLTWDALNDNPPENTASDEVKLKIYYIGIGSHLDLEITKDTIPEILAEVKQQLVPGKGVPDVGYREESGWLFGFDFMLSDLFRVRTLLYSPKLYGAVIEVQASKKSPLAFFNGLLLELFYKKISDSTGMFHCRLIVPKQYADFSLGVLEVHLGQFLLEIYTNGSFYLDLGFPHNQNFSSSFGLSFGIYGGKGGFYFGTFTGDAVNSVPEVTNGSFSPVVKIGIGLSVGLSRSFDLGIVKGGVSLMMVGIFEGVFAVFKPREKEQEEALYYKAKASVGIYGSLFLSVDLKVIAVSASASIAALCELTLESYRKAQVVLELDLMLSASIKILFFKIQFSFHFHQKASFSFGSESSPPWQIAENGKESRLRSISAILPDTGKRAGEWSIAPVIAPLCSVINPLAGEPSYCLAFLPVIQQTDMQSVLEMLLKWVLDHISGKTVTAEDAEAIIKADFGGSLTYDGLLRLLSENMTIAPRLAGQQAAEGTGIVFPMLPQLSLTADGRVIDFGEAKISESDMQRISEYFYQLNADPVYGPTEKNGIADEIPLCGAILTDWFQMALEEVTGKIQELFSSITVSTASVLSAAETYGGSLEEIFYHQPELLLDIPVIPEYRITLAKGDSLQGIQERIAEQYDFPEESLWEAAASALVFCDELEILYEGYRFDNQKAGLTLLQLGAVFFVRLFDPEVFYTPYAEFILENNPVDLDWECLQIGDAVLTLSKDGRSYTALSGDTVVRIAKMRYLLEQGELVPEWILFRESFLSCNGGEGSEVPESCGLPESYVYHGKGYVEGSVLFRTCYPDFAGNPSRYPLWKAPVLKPMAVLTLKNARVSECAAVSELLKTYEMAALILAIEQYGAELSGEQEVEIQRPGMISKEEIENRILTSDMAEQTGSILSRGFLQGARPFAPGTQKETPLYQLTGQQIPWVAAGRDYKVQLSVSDPSLSWLCLNTEEVVWTAEWMAKLLPEGTLEKPGLPVPVDSLHAKEKCWSAAKGDAVLNGSGAEFITMLPKDCIFYIRTYQKLPRLEEGEMPDACWCSIVDIDIRKKSEGVYYVYGAAAAEREFLYRLSCAKTGRCRLFYTPSKLESEKSGLAELQFQSCFLIQTNLSKETHGRLLMSQNGENPYVASVDDAGKFWTLLWECSVIGGGFWLCHDGDSLPEDIFDENGGATLRLAAELLDAAADFDAVNGIRLFDTGNSITLFGEEETVYAPVLPKGCVGYQMTCPVREDTLQNLYQLLGYRVYSEVFGKAIESAPILPVSDSEEQFGYQIAVPLWKLSQPEGSCYAAVGKTFELTFDLRDVLGNSLELGQVLVTGEYNDNLIALHELPDTRWKYGFIKADSDIYLKITGTYAAGSGTEQEGKRKTAETAADQLNCPDIELTAETTLGDEPYTIESEKLEELRGYVKNLCQNLQTSLSEAIAPIELLIPLDPGRLPVETVLISVFLTVRRKTSESKSEQINRAKSLIPADSDKEKFAADFCAAFGMGSKLAYDSTEALYYVPLKHLVGEIRVQPYTYPSESGELLSPEFVSFAPFSNTLVTRAVEVTLYDGKQEVRNFANIDANIWEKQFLSDMEYLLNAEPVCRAAAECQEALRVLTDAKKNLADLLSERILPIRKESADIPLEQVKAFVKDRLFGNLELVYGTSVILVYQAKVDSKELLRFFPSVNFPGAVSVTKLSEENNVFCLFLSGEEKEMALDIKLPEMEYAISSTSGGYDRSEWLRFETPVSNEEGSASIDLRMDTKIPCPRRECPLPPVFKKQDGQVTGEEFLRWSWSGEISCGAYEQYTVCVQLDFSEGVRKRSGRGRDSFDVLADYFCKREQLWEDLQGEKFASAYERIADLAGEFSEHSGDTLPKQNFRGKSLQSVMMQIAIEFDGEGKVSYQILPDADRDRILEQSGAVLHPVEGVSGSKQEGMLTFRLSLSHLPVYSCCLIKPAAWIVQNDRLFSDGKQQVREEFIFRTEQVSLPSMRIFADYPDAVSLEGEDLESAVKELWCRLQLDGDKTAAVSVMYKYRIPGNGSGLYCDIPVTFLPEADCDSLAENVKDWLSGSGYELSKGSCLSFDVVLYQREESAALVHVRFLAAIRQSGHG